MAVLISTSVKGQTTEGYEGVLMLVKQVVQNAPGFIMHCAHPDDGEWKVYEIWQSKTEADLAFAKFVVPNLPPGIHPKRSYKQLHTVLTKNE